MSDGKDPAVLFYPKDWLTDTAEMTDEEKGRYIDLLCIQHQNGHLSKRTIERQPEAVQEKFCQDSDGKYYNKRMDREKEKRKAYTESRRANGGKGGRPKKPTQNHMVSHMDSTENPYAKPTENHTGNGNGNVNTDANRGDLRQRIEASARRNGGVI